MVVVIMTTLTYCLKLLHIATDMKQEYLALDVHVWYMLVVHLQWAERMSAHTVVRVRFYQAGASEGGRADTINGDALDAELCLQMVISFQR